MKAVTLTAEDALEDLPDRIVVSPGHGKLVVPPSRSFTSEGEVVRAGDVLASLEASERTVDVCAPCDAWVLSYLVRDGERVQPGSAIVHLRAL